MRDIALPDDFERAASRGLPMPEGLDSSQQRLYLSLRHVYYAYRQGIVSREDAKREKEQLMEAYRKDPVRAFVDAVKDTENSRREYHRAAAAGADAEHLLAIAKQIIRDATGDATF